ncbi:MAG TPA: 3-deoxy-manno-octulosonate cytidylyltransferase [Candidatus Hydrogenedentes bacterium]|nr:3-deoxy-manno-octulosonate cytidylyltransferase [Candidatus Hydrogenedentota bacterium]
MKTSVAPKILAVVPARYASTRFPGKIIAPLLGKPLVVHTFERACQASLVTETLIATDDPIVVEAVKPYNVPVMLTRADHQSGTDRIAEVVEKHPADIIVNVQGDEPLIDRNTIDEAIRPLLERPEVMMTTARRLITDPEDVENPNVVKVVCDTRGDALYFSRWPIPYIRDETDRGREPFCHWQHIGLYVYRRDFLLQYAKMPLTPLEKLEKLEQLRALENGYKIAVIDTDYEALGVDTKEDLVRVEAVLQAKLKEG